MGRRTLVRVTMPKAPSLLLTLLLLFGLGGCFDSESSISAIDRKLFAKIGGTLFGSPSQVTLKEVHLDSGRLAGRDVIVEGAILEFGKHETFLVLGDDSARLLVVLTDVPKRAKELVQLKSERIRILGVVEHGKKGLPLVTARSVQLSPSPGKA